MWSLLGYFDGTQPYNKIKDYLGFGACIMIFEHHILKWVSMTRITRYWDSSSQKANMRYAQLLFHYTDLVKLHIDVVKCIYVNLPEYTDIFDNLWIYCRLHWMPNLIGKHISYTFKRCGVAHDIRNRYDCYGSLWEKLVANISSKTFSWYINSLD